MNGFKNRKAAVLDMGKFNPADYGFQTGDGFVITPKAKPVEWKYNEWDNDRLNVTWSDGSEHGAGWGPNGEAPIFTEDTPIGILIRACDYSWDMNETSKGEAAKEEAEAAAVELRRRDAKLVALKSLADAAMENWIHDSDETDANLFRAANQYAEAAAKVK